MRNIKKGSSRFLTEKENMDSLVSVVIPTYNRCDNLLALIYSISDSDYENVEIIVVDNNSSDNTKAELIKIIDSHAIRVPVRYIYANANLNASGGRYVGARYAKGDYILFIDDDNKILPDMIRELVVFSEKNTEAGLIAPCSLICDSQDFIQNLGAWVDLNTSKAIFRQPSPIKICDVDDSISYDTLSALNSFMVTRKAYESSGGWDPNFGIMFDESDLAMRIKESGYKAFFAPRARCIHFGATFAGEQNELRRLGMGTPLRAFFFARNRSLFMRRYARWNGKVLYFLVYMHAFTAYYCFKAIKNKRIDIAAMYLKGVVAGAFCRKSINDGFDNKEIRLEEYNSNINSNATLRI